MTRAPRAPSGSLQWTCDRFNQQHKVGTTIRAHPGPLDTPTVEMKIIAPGAYVLSGHTAVVQVSGGYGCIALSHVVWDRGGGDG